MSVDYQKIKSAIVPVSSFNLTIEEDKLFKKYNPLGYILFSRNYKDPAQLKKLIDSLKEASGREDILIVIDQEGERVARLREPHFKVLQNAEKYGQEAKINLEEAVKKLRADFAIVGKQLKDVGINVNCAPVADLYQLDANPIIGVRSYGGDIETVIALCKAVDAGLADSHVQSVVKHIPGHGRAKVDSHFQLPIVDTDLKTLLSTDFKVFQGLKSMKLAMTAHIVFTAIDEDAPVTLSKKAIDYIRKNIGFCGLIMTDALDMKALSGDIKEITRKASESGCDILLYCESNLSQIEAVLISSHALNSEIVMKIKSLNYSTEKSF